MPLCLSGDLRSIGTESQDVGERMAVSRKTSSRMGRNGRGWSSGWIGGVSVQREGRGFLGSQANGFVEVKVSVSRCRSGRGIKPIPTIGDW